MPYETLNRCKALPQELQELPPLNSVASNKHPVLSFNLLGNSPFITSVLIIKIMAYDTEADEYYQGFPEGTEGQHMEERLVESLSFHVQDSVNQALIKALKPFTAPMRRYGQGELRGRTPNLNVSGKELTPDLGLAQRASVVPSSSEILAQMAASVLKDNEYEPFSLLGPSGPTSGPSLIALDASKSTSSHSSDSDQALDDPKPAGQSKQKSKILKKTLNLSFDPQVIILPRSTEWIPCTNAHYVQDRI
ncbi:hypothetical protein NDU88_006182 [Pleurodeles waltl]|uniref:Uncharacterized protein n=1 Tax=Pleurodeles waltl TaxID=8319 RepID=A0AAV7PLR1_PLEWA|nr:hypothetical protein NDU88_006182 [Pleurodeles waltl]